MPTQDEILEALRQPCEESLLAQRLGCSETQVSLALQETGALSLRDRDRVYWYLPNPDCLQQLIQSEEEPKAAIEAALRQYFNQSLQE